MKININHFIIIIILTIQILHAFENIPIIKANSIHVDIKDGNKFKQKAWRITPETNPDIYSTSSHKVTFYTDIDSISFEIRLEDKYDFIILLNEKDSAITRIIYEPSKLEILKDAEKYNFDDNRFIPEFEYQSKDDINLTRIREELRLDSIAGNGNELSQIFNLMHWIHNLINHDGSSINPTIKNAIDLINVCSIKERGLNCRMLATILNECYLSIGIKSRYVTCMPKESEFNDCHVINMVYSTNLKKWIWIDPSFESYVMDIKGNLLSIQEVREKLIKGDTLILNADANLNREKLVSKEYYLEYYMAKNLYRLQTPLISEYNTETWEKSKKVSYVELLPLDGIEQTPQKVEFIDKITGVTFTYYKTNNPNLFWKSPE